MNNVPKTKRSIIRVVLIVTIIFMFLFAFVSCGDVPTSSAERDDPAKPSSTYEIPEADLKETSPSSSQNSTPTTVRYAASRESNKYHRPSCYYVDNILPENLFYFSTETAARGAGYSPCSVCKP